MKKVLGILFLSLFLFSFVFADSKSVARTDFYIKDVDVPEPSVLEDGSCDTEFIFSILIYGLGIFVFVYFIVLAVKRIFWKPKKILKRKVRKKISRKK